MDRSEFLKACGYACLSGVAVTTLFSSCVSTLNLDLEAQNQLISVDEAEFELVKKGKTTFRKYVLIHTSSLQYPICLYKLDNEYKALLLKCTHQGAELQVFGERIVCPAHGAEYNNKGEVQEGPAQETLHSFPLKRENGKIIISIAQ